MNAKERDQHVTPCPHCGADAEWSFLDPEKNRVEVMCPDCGRYEMTKDDFDQAAVEATEVNEPDRS